MDKKQYTLELTEEERKWIRIALDREGDIRSDNGDVERANFLYKLSEQLRN